SFSVVGGRLKSVFSNATFTCNTTSRKLTTAAIVVICFLSVFVLLAVIGSSITAFEYYAKVKFSKNYDGGSKDGKSVDFDEVKMCLQGRL
ncbi:hypothetical protein AVEN_15824-1, partial [Araneus ventricosus]